MAAKKTTTKKTATRKQATAKQAPAKKPAAKKKAPAKPAAKKMSAVNAAAKLLGEAKEPLTAQQMIERMAAKGYWKSPGGRTPSHTLYSAIIRDIQRQGDDSRFRKADRGLFTLNK